MRSSEIDPRMIEAAITTVYREGRILRASEELSRLALALSHIHFECRSLREDIESIAYAVLDFDQYLERQASIQSSLREVVTHIAETETFRDVLGDVTS